MSQTKPSAADSTDLPKADIAIGGKSYEVRFNVATIVAIEAATGMTATALASLMLEWFPDNARKARRAADLYDMSLACRFIAAVTRTNFDDLVARVGLDEPRTVLLQLMGPFVEALGQAIRIRDTQPHPTSSQPKATTSV